MIQRFQASEAARQREGCGFFKWHVIYSIEDFRSEALWQVRDKLNLPWLAIVPLAKIPDLIWAAEYGCKFQFHEAPLFVLQCAEAEAEAWLN